MGNDLNTSMGVTALYDGLKAKANDATKLAILDRFFLCLVQMAGEKGREKEGGEPGAAPNPKGGGHPRVPFCRPHPGGGEEQDNQEMEGAPGDPKNKAGISKGGTPSGIN